MKRAPLFYPRIILDSQESLEYAESASNRSTQIGRIMAKRLRNFGFIKGKVLELGSGGGDLIIEIAKQLPEVEGIGIDLSEPLLEISRLKARKIGLEGRVAFEKGDVQNMPFPNESFDLAISLNVLHVLEDPLKMVNEVFRVLNSDGKLLVSDIHRSWISVIMPMLRTAYTMKEVEEIMKKTQFKYCRVEKHLFWLGIEAWKSGNPISK